MRVQNTWHVAFLALSMLGFFTATPVAAQSNHNTVQLDRVTDEEVDVIGRWEDTPLWRGKKQTSTVHYPLEKSAQRCDNRNCTNGCTIGFGYNLGAHTREMIRTDFNQAGIPTQKTDALVALAKLTGTKAVAQCGSNAPAQSSFPQLTREESVRLLRFKIQSYKDDVVQRARREGVLAMLNSAQLAVLVALDYQSPVLSSKATQLWRQLTQGNMPAVQSNIRHNSGTHLEPALQRRRNWEARYFIKGAGLIS